MKKIIYVFLFIFITLLILFNFINKNDYIEEKNNFNKFPFYKKDLQKEYENYQNKTKYADKKVVLDVNMHLNKPFYEGSVPSKYLNTNYILVNKYNYLDRNYVPNNLVILDQYAKEGIRLNKEAYNAFIEMANDAKKNNLNLRIISAYRSYDYQENLYNSYLKHDSKEKVDTYSARAGYSEHQTGLVIDIDNGKTDYNKFHLTKEFFWMKDNCYKYGYILRYPLGKEKITGYKYESWHYRYVGKKIAKYIYENDITFEEYYYEFIDK